MILDWSKHAFQFDCDYILTVTRSYIFTVESNNAGVMAPLFTLSKDKIELQFATNHLGHFLLTNLLLETMKTTSREHKKEGRIVNVSSMGHHMTNKGIYTDKINDESRYTTQIHCTYFMRHLVCVCERLWFFLWFSYSPLYAYGQSKLANILHANELTRQFKEERVELTANSLHPGAIATSLLRHHNFLEGVMKWVGKYFQKTIPQGAATTCYVALHPQVKGVSGEYFSDRNIAKPSSLAKDSDLAKKLWDFSLGMVAL
ncbi:putative very-long-chain 3-oxoacyl-CoA reductase [Helianthus annuus]|nr:putative very-long-chain 3-oxoacyl-CoA reductase [Helianthus annuus]